MPVQYRHESIAKAISHRINIKMLGFGISHPSQYFVGYAESPLCWHYYTPKLSFYRKGVEGLTSLFYHK